LNLVLKEIDRKEKADAYFHSISVARLAHLVVGGLGGKDAAQKIKFNDLMPFKASDIFGRQESDCTPRTRMIVDRLIKSGRLPLFLMPVLMDELDE
jgi:hypothetical protein